MHTNRLIFEKSPYLLQHAHNPVDWYPWNETAFSEAKKQEKPIFLSIGYSTCHWCHVMERESFEDEQVADLLNRYFISIKVDREERPDVDGVYMHFCQLLNGSGGWPLTVLMTPEQKPFFVGTYFPKEDRDGRIGMISLLTRTAELWKSQRSRLMEAAEEVLDFHLKQEKSYRISCGSKHTDEGNLTMLKAARDQLAQQFDPKYGGFGIKLLFLLKMNGEQDRSMVEKTLHSMYAGGIFDHIGGGFSRYSTDEKWVIPHFEKMLYDNALLLLSYTEAYQITKDPLYGEIAEHIFFYLEQNLLNKRGGFFCGQDTDSQGEEEKHLDDKILTSWNGIAIWALSRAYQVLEEPPYYRQAKKAAAFLRANLMTLNGRMKARWCRGHVAFEGTLDDYAFFCLGLFQLYQCDFNVSWLRTCILLTEEMYRQFWDEVEGGFFFTSESGESLILRQKQTYDGAMPSGNSAAALLLVWLSQLTGDEHWHLLAQKQISYLKREMQGQEMNHTLGLLALWYWEHPAVHLVCTSEEYIPEREIRAYRNCQNGDVWGIVLTKQNEKALKHLIPELESYEIGSKILYHICRDQQCQKPVFELDF